MFERLTAIVGFLATITVSAVILPTPAHAARQAVCQHPDGSQCTAKKDSGRIECQCLDGDVELTDQDITGANEDELMDACWDAWSQVCAPWTPEVTCEEPSLGSCTVSADDGGRAYCDCAATGEVEEELSSLDGLDEDELTDECHVQLERICMPPDPIMGPPPPVMDDFEDAPPAASCSIDPAGGTPWVLMMLVGFGVTRRRRGRWSRRG